MIGLGSSPDSPTPPRRKRLRPFSLPSNTWNLYGQPGQGLEHDDQLQSSGPSMGSESLTHETHPPGPIETSEYDGVEHRCSFCAKVFFDLKRFRRHVKFHVGEKTFKCELCAAGFIQPSDLRKHQRTHTGEKPFPCSYCHMSFSQSGDRNRHQGRVHRK